MEPKKEYLRFCHSMMLSSKKILTEMTKQEECLKAFLPGIIIVAFRNPLLRMATIDNGSCIAHVVPRGPIVESLDNPLENRSSQGDLRARIYGNLGKLVIECNEGRKELSPIAKELHDAAEQFGLESVTPTGLNWQAAEQHSHLRQALRPSFGDAFNWKQVSEYSLFCFKRAEIIQRGDTHWDTPLFDIILLSS